MFAGGGAGNFTSTGRLVVEHPGGSPVMPRYESLSALNCGNADRREGD